MVDQAGDPNGVHPGRGELLIYNHNVVYVIPDFDASIQTSNGSDLVIIIIIGNDTCYVQLHFCSCNFVIKITKEYRQL